MVPTAIDVFVAIEKLVPFAFVMDADIVLLVIVRGHVEDEEKVTVIDMPFESENALIGVIDHRPRVMAWVIFLNVHGRLGPVDKVKIPYEPPDGVVFWESQKDPRKGTVLVPFVEGGKLVAHEVELLAWVGELISEEVP